MSTFLLYLLLILPSVKDAIAVMAVLTLVGTVVFGLVSFLYWSDDPCCTEKLREVWCKIVRILPYPVGVLVLLSFVPDLPIILALIGWELAGSDVLASLADLPPKFAEYINAIIDRELLELKEVVK